MGIFQKEKWHQIEIDFFFYSSAKNNALNTQNQRIKI